MLLPTFLTSIPLSVNLSCLKLCDALNHFSEWGYKCLITLVFASSPILPYYPCILEGESNWKITASTGPFLKCVWNISRPPLQKFLETQKERKFAPNSLKRNACLCLTPTTKGNVATSYKKNWIQKCFKSVSIHMLLEVILKNVNNLD